eukprot:365298-Chlamydomonas_euryale.AAC.9
MTVCGRVGGSTRSTSVGMAGWRRPPLRPVPGNSVNGEHWTWNDGYRSPFRATLPQTLLSRPCGPTVDRAAGDATAAGLPPHLRGIDLAALVPGARPVLDAIKGLSGVAGTVWDGGAVFAATAVLLRCGEVLLVAWRGDGGGGGGGSRVAQGEL